MAKGKGSDYERVMCRKLSLWWTDGKRDDLFWRSAGSGAMAKTRGRRGAKTFGQYGDIQATDPEGQPLVDMFTLELKRGYNKDCFTTMLDKPDKAAQQMWETFYHQVNEDRTNAESLTWALIWKRDRKEALIYMPPLIIGYLIRAGATVNHRAYMKGRIRLKSGKLIPVFTCSLEDFLETVKPRHIRKVLAGVK